MTAVISLEQAEAEFDALMARAEAGEVIYITRDGRPVAYLGPPPPGFIDWEDGNDDPGP